MQRLSLRLLVCLFFCISHQGSTSAQLSVGATVTDVTPPSFPVYVNGGMTARQVSEVNTPVNARTLVLDDGERRIALVVVDSCMIPKFLLDDIKALASKRTKIRADHMMISSTHTHTAPSVMGALGTPPDANYIPFLREKIAESIAAAESKLAPAHVGWASINADKFTATRRWIRRTDRVDEDPFGNRTVLANMHSARVPENVTGPSGPEDPDLQLIGFATPEGTPIAVMANFSMHYFGDKLISADYFGLFCNGFQERIAKSEADAATSEFVAILSHGCSGDIWRRDYSAGPDGNFNPSIDEYTSELLDLATKAHRRIEYKPVDVVELQESRMQLNYRVPSAERLAWAQSIVKEMGDRLPKTKPEIYAREQLFLHEAQSTEVVVQGIRIGDIGIATTPNETYALTGLKLKHQSPFKHQMVIELANGGDGYIPPPEQHVLGGYNTWAARSAGLEVEAEPKITEAALQLLESLSGTPRQAYSESVGKLTKRVLDAKPYAFYRQNEMGGEIAWDYSGNGRDCVREPGYALFLDGPDRVGICESGDHNRAAHFAGSRLHLRLPSGSQAARPASYSVGMWFWNGMPSEGREITGWLMSRDRRYRSSLSGDHLGIMGKQNPGRAGRLMFVHGQDDPVFGITPVRRWAWNHVLFVRDGETVRVYLNGSKTPELQTKSKVDALGDISDLFIAGRSDGQFPFEGKLDEIVIFDRAVSATEVHALSFTP